MVNDQLDKRITEVSSGNFGVLAALTNARHTLGDKHLVDFLDKVSERGEALWLRFRAFQKERPSMSFNHFIASVIMPNPFPNS